MYLYENDSWDLHGGPVVKNLSSDAEDTVQSQVGDLRSNMPWATERMPHIQPERHPPHGSEDPVCHN